MPFPPAHWLVGFLLAVMSVDVAASASVPAWRLSVARLATSAATAQTIEVQVSSGADGRSALQLDIGVLQLPALKQSLRALRWTCPALPEAPGAVTCQGRLQVAGRDAGTLSIDVSALAAQLRWAQGRRQLGLDWRAAAPDSVAIGLQRLPVSWLQAFLAELWPDGHFPEGRLSGRLRVDTGPQDALAVDAQLQTAGLAIEGQGGTIAAAGLGASLEVGFRSSPQGRSIIARVHWQRGELLAGPIYVAIPERGFRSTLQLARQGAGAWQLPVLAWDDGEVLRLDGRGRLTSEGDLAALQLTARSLDLSAASSRYLAGVLAPAGFPDLLLQGEAKVGFEFDEEGLVAVETAMRGVNAVDPRGRFSLASLDGGLHWDRAVTVPDSRLAWQAASLQGIGLGAGELELISEQGALVQRGGARMPLLGGHLTLQRLRWQPARGAVPLRMQLGLQLDNLDLGALSQRLGWPAFVGSVSGTLPNAVYQNNRIAFEGGLSMTLFGGEVSLANLELERPFGVAPSLATDIRFQDIDLAPLTRVFGFGEISGRLDGRLRDLRLVDWQPVAFDARFVTDKNWEGPRRVSQRAVQDISDLAGSGLMAGLQAQALKIFDSFRYDRIGVGCVLADNVCRMSGLRKRGEGFVIIRGKGLPRLDVIGYRRTVDWPTLIKRLNAVAEGEELRIE